MIRGVRGAITVKKNEVEDIKQATQYLVSDILRKNDIQVDDIASAFFSLSPDLDAAFPAMAVREMGWEFVPMLCFHEISVPKSLERCIRVLLHWETGKKPQEIIHVYLKEAAQLRPDFISREC